MASTDKTTKYSHPVLLASDRHRQYLAMYDPSQAALQVRQYRQTYAAAIKQSERLEKQLEQQMKGGKRITQAQLFRLEQYQRLEQQLRVAGNKYARYSYVDAKAEWERGLEDGGRHALDLVKSYFPDDEDAQEAIGIGWNMVNTDLLEVAAGMFAEGEALQEKIEQFYSVQVADQALGRIATGLALGQNPNVVGRELQKTLGWGLQQSLTLARTAHLYAYREAQRANFVANNDVVGGWIWKSAADKRTCISCWAMHGTHHLNDEVLNDHHNGRCMMIPILAGPLGLNNPVVEPGETIFNRLSYEDQKDIMGAARHQLWITRKVKFSDMVGSHENEVWGPMRVPTPVYKLLGKDRPIPPGTLKQQLHNVAMGKQSVKPTQGGDQTLDYSTAHGASVREKLLKNKKVLKANADYEAASQRKDQAAAVYREKSDALWKSYDESKAVREKYSYESPQYQAILKRQEALRKEMFAASDEVDVAASLMKKAERKRQREGWKLIPTYDKKDQMGLEITYATSMNASYKNPNPTKATVKRMESARDWLRSRLKVRFDDDHQVANVRIEKNTTGRAFSYGGHQGAISVAKGEDMDVIVHEFTHNMEGTRGLEYARKRQRFYNNRTANYEIESFYDLEGYGPRDEWCIKDKFYSSYAGRLYTDPKNPSRLTEPIRAYANEGYPEVAKSNEVITMGVQALYNDPLKFAQSDAEYFDFIVSWMGGEL